MFENIVTNLKNKSSLVSDSVESLKGKTSSLSNSLFSIKTNLIHKTHSLSSYLTNDHFGNKPTKTSTSAPNLNDNSCKSNEKQNDLLWPTLKNNKVEYVSYNPVATDDDDDLESNIVDRFVRVVSFDEDRPVSKSRASVRRRNDREEIRRRLATGCDGDEYYGNDRPGRKPSLQARLQSGMNLQICFMNDTMSDTESPSNEVEPTQTNKSPVKFSTIETVRPEQKLLHFNSNITANQGLRGGLNLPLNQNNELQTEADFFMNQARLQAEARVALAQAKDMARLQMEMDRQRKQMSPITEMLRQTLHKVGVKFPQDRRRVSRQMLTDMNVAQLQVIVNDLHSQIEYLNESLVKLLMERDDLHMSQDSMLVDIEDLTRYLGAKENMFKEDLSQNNNVPTKPKINRIASLIRK
uniref:Schwannomin interacting protein 1 C-terminal domain-containing protein n=1 Tax=Clastoptera arizonana TaxID=38151 RepID=A0A1B6CT13_9HEMI